MNEAMNCQWRIAARPDGNVKPSDFEYREEQIPQINGGEFLLRTLYLGVRPVMRMYMQGHSVAGERALDIGDVLHGRGVAQVVKSNNPDFAVGDIVHGQLGWQTWKASRGTRGERFIKMQNTDLPLSYGAGVTGMNGFSAYCGLMECGKPQPGETLVVSAAAGGVGTNVVQIGRILGCRVIGIAGGPDKCALVESLGCHAVIDYKNEDVGSRLAALCPQGIDIYFDNVGGAILEAALENLRMGARIVLCGSIAEYTDIEKKGPPNYTNLRAVNGSMNGFFIYNFEHLFPAAENRLADWIRVGEMQPVQNIVDGFEKMPEALAELYSGKNTGVQVCKVRGEQNEWPPLPSI